MTLQLDRPWLRFDLGAPHRVLSHALHRPGFVTTNAITWREVRNADLSPEFDVATWYAQALAEKGWSGDVGLMTSRDLGKVETAYDMVEDVCVTAVATVGLTNAEAIGTRRACPQHHAGTINVALRISLPLSDIALIEALSLVASARTAAILEAGRDLPTGRATGTGTDCIAVAAPAGEADYAGMHTAQGEAIGRAAYRAVLQGARHWMENPP